MKKGIIIMLSTLVIAFLMPIKNASAVSFTSIIDFQIERHSDQTICEIRDSENLVPGDVTDPETGRTIKEPRAEMLCALAAENDEPLPEYCNFPSHKEIGDALNSTDCSGVIVGYELFHIQGSG